MTRTARTLSQLAQTTAAAIAAAARSWRHAFSDFHTTIENVIAEEDWVAFQLRHEGTHLGEFPRNTCDWPPR
jgi:predicted ester cyclase